MIRYLSLDWINALSDEVTASDTIRAIAEAHQHQRDPGGH